MTLRMLYFLGFVIVFLSSCQTEVFNDESSYDQVDSQLWPYFKAFEEEASARGLDYDLNSLDLSGEVAAISDDGVAGSCQYGSHITNHVTIDKEFWNAASTNTREYVVFHELGHCVLLRGHDESTNSGGFCLSIMASGTGDCMPTYQQSNRATFLDELFFEGD